MPQIIINEISDNFTYTVQDTSYATVALPITSCWGPGFFDPQTVISDNQATDPADKLALELEGIAWAHFPATQQGIESFVSNYRGPAANYRMAKDYSYYMALTLLTAGYDVLVCRLSPGTVASTPSFAIKNAEDGDVSDCTMALKAKYPGTFGNQLICSLYKPTNRNYWNLITYVKDSSGVKTAVENIAFVFDPTNATDAIPYVDEVESEFVQIVHTGNIKDDYKFQVNGEDTKSGVELSGALDRQSVEEDTKACDVVKDAANLALQKFYQTRTADSVTVDNIDAFQYMVQLKKNAGITGTPTDGQYTTADEGSATVTDMEVAETQRYREWLFRYVVEVYELLKDKLAYNPNRIMSPGWDDIDVTSIGGTFTSDPGADKVCDCISPIHLKLMECAYHSRCATAYLDVPKCLPRQDVYSDSDSHEGYAQMLATYEPDNTAFDVNGSLYATHSALFAPWGQYKFVGTAKYNVAPPSFLTLMIERSMVLNQSLQYEWILPSSRTHNVQVAKLDYTVPKKVLDVWQPVEEDGGVGVNVITDIPGFGVTAWGNFTLFNTPPAVHQALRSLSTRKLVCALEDVIYKAGLSITFQYSNQQAYSRFHAGVTPLLDTMKNCGALEDYYVTMAQDLDAAGMVKANSVVGKVYIVPAGVVERITVDLIALPPGSDLTPYMQ